MSSETLFDVARVTLARLRAVRPASARRGLLTTAAHSLRVVAAAATEGDDEAEAEEKEEQDRTFYALGQVQEICASLEERLALYDYPEASITHLEASHTNNTTHTVTNAEEKCAEEEASCVQDVELCLCTTSPLLRTLAWLAHTQRPRISTLDERGSEAQGEERKTADSGAGVQRNKADLRPEVSYTLDAQCRALWSFPDTVASTVLASSSHTNTTTFREGGRDDEMYGGGGSSSSGGGAASLDSLRGFSFSSELYYVRLADALWVFALTTSPTTTATTTECTTQEASGGSSSISGETYEEKDGRAVVYAMLRSGVARGFSHILQQRLILALRSVLCHALPCEAHGCLGNILLGIMAGADVGRQRSRAAGFHLTHRKALQQTSSENESIQVRTRRWRLSASWQDWLRCLCTTAMTRSTSTSCSEGESSDETLLPQRSWANVLHEMLVELLHSSAACSAARALAAVHISTAHEEEQDEEIGANEPSVMDLLAQRVCYGVCVELTSRQNTPRSLLRFIFHNLLRTFPPPSPQRQITRRSECVGEAALQAVFDAWASASCVQHGDLALNETLQHAVLYAMRWLVTHKDKSKEKEEKEGEKNEEQTRPQQKQQHFPTRWLGALLSGITLRLESVRTEALRQAALCVAAAFALYFVEAAEAVQNLLQDAQYASALNDWLAEEEEEEADESKSANDERVMQRREGLKLRSLSSSPYSTHNVKSWAAGRGLPVRRVVAYSRTQRYPLDPDEPFMHFVHEQEKDEEEEGERTSLTGATRLVRDASTPTTAITAYHRNSTSQDGPGAATAAVQQTARVQDLPSFGLRRLPGEPHTIMSYVDPTLNQQNNNNNSTTLVRGGRTKNRKSNEEEDEDEDAILYMPDPAQQSQQHNSVSLRSLHAAYDALAGIGRSSQAQLYEVQEEQERGLRGLLWCLRRHVRQMQSVATAQQTQVTSPATTFTLSELGPMLPTLLPVLMGLAFHAPEAERAQLLAYRTEALELLLVAAPTLSLAQLSTMIYNSRYGIAERVAMLDAIRHAAHRLSTLTQSAASSATHTNNNNNNNTMKKGANGNARVMPRRIYPPIPTHDHTHRGGTSMSAHSRAGPIRRAIVVNEGSRGQTRRWGYAVHGRQQNRNYNNNNDYQSRAHAPVLFYNAFAPHAMSFLAVLLARLDKEHYKFFQSDDPYSPAAVLRALWYILDGVRLVRHVAPRLCGEAMPFLCSAAAQHPHAAVRKFAWIMCGEAMRCWCGAVPLFTPTRGRPADKKSHTRNSTTSTSTSISNNEGEEAEEEGGLRRTPMSEAYKGYDGGHSFMFSEEWLAGFAALERVASALLGNSGADRSTCEMALLVMCDLRELVEGTREAAWMAEQNTAHAIEIV